MVEQTFAILGTITDKHNTLEIVTVLYDKVYVMANKKLMNGKALGKHSLHEKTAASVLLKLFISGNE